MELIGREAELAIIDKQLEQASNGVSSVLILRGDSGVGKSALLAAATERAQGMRILRATGVESGISMPFAGLHQLLRPIVDRIDGLIGVQAAALRAALGFSTEEPASLFLVGAALLTLLAEAAEDKPLLFMVDDAHWLDDPSSAALAFAARRLEAEPIAGLITVREEAPRDFAIPGVPVLRLDGLRWDAAEQLLDRLDGDIAPEVRRRLIVEAGGNPLSLKELAPALTSAQLRGQSPLPSWLPLPDRLIHSYQERIGALPKGALAWLLLAAADGWLDLESLCRAAARLGASTRDLLSAKEAGLISDDGGKVGFPHPLIRSAVYQAVSEASRVEVHRTLAQTLDRREDEDRRIWHLAAATVGSDDLMATKLEAVADEAERRRGLAAAVVSLERAAELSGNDLHARRLVRAAGANLEIGRRDRTRALLAQAESITPDARVSAELIFFRARLAMQTTTTTNADIQMLMAGAKPVSDSDPELAAAMLNLACFLGWYGRDWSLVVAAARQLLELQLSEGSPLKLRAREIIKAYEPDASEEAPWSDPGDDLYGELVNRRRVPELWMPSIDLAGVEEPGHQLLERAARHMRAKGELWSLIPILINLALADFLLGRWSSAMAYGTEALSLARQTGHEFQEAVSRVLLAKIPAIKGDRSGCQELLDGVKASEQTCSLVVGFRAWAVALLELSLGNPEQAFENLTVLAPPEEWPDRNHVALRATGDMAEAAILSGLESRAVLVLRGLERWAGPRPRPWVQVILHRNWGLLDPNPKAAEAHFKAALSVRGGDKRPWEHARARLLYGEWLRRRRRRDDARLQLRSALETFTRLGATPWSERALGELRATGETVWLPDRSISERLSAQELQVARMATRGLTNRQIGAQLFLSPRTVASHLYRLFPKLGIGSRSDLRRIKLDQPGEAAARNTT